MTRRARHQGECSGDQEAGGVREKLGEEQGEEEWYGVPAGEGGCRYHDHRKKRKKRWACCIELVFARDGERYEERAIGGDRRIIYPQDGIRRPESGIRSVNASRRGHADMIYRLLAGCLSTGFKASPSILRGWATRQII